MQTKSGITVSYWKITDWKINQSAKSADIILTPYISSQTRMDGYEPIRDEVRKIRATDYFVKEGSSANRTDYTDYFSPIALEKSAKDGKTIYNIMYEYIKIKYPEFADANDV
jgi:hypothetical protein